MCTAAVTALLPVVLLVEAVCKNTDPRCGTENLLLEKTCSRPGSVFSVRSCSDLAKRSDAENKHSDFKRSTSR